MTSIFTNYIANLVPIATGPVSITYLGLAAVHLIVMRCYLSHPDGRPLALCAGVTSTLYLFLAFHYGLAQ